MGHPWEEVTLSDYEGHMALVGQLQALNAIMQRQFSAFPQAKSGAVWGVAGGNGLEHGAELQTLYGIDVNPAYLAACRSRFLYLGDKLRLVQADLSSLDAPIPHADLVIANLLLEYIGIGLFAAQLLRTSPCYLSCVVQRNLGAAFVSPTQYEAAFSGIGALHQDIRPSALCTALAGVGYVRVKEEVYPLPNQKQLIRLDFEKAEPNSVAILN